MIQAIIEEKLTDPTSLSVILFQLARKHSYEWDEEVVNARKSLRDVLVEKIMKDAKDIAPHVTPEQWQEAAKRLQKD